MKYLKIAFLVSLFCLTDSASAFVLKFKLFSLGRGRYSIALADDAALSRLESSLGVRVVSTFKQYSYMGTVDDSQLIVFPDLGVQLRLPRRIGDENESDMNETLIQIDIPLNVLVGKTFQYK